MFEQINLTDITTFGSAILIIGGATTYIVNVVKKTITKVSKEAIDNAFENFSKDFTEKINLLSNQLELHLKEGAESNKKIEHCLLTSARERINQAHEHYLAAGKISTHTLYALEDMYCSYKALNGNSFTDKQMEDLRELQVINY